MFKILDHNKMAINIKNVFNKEKHCHLQEKFYTKPVTKHLKQVIFLRCTDSKIDKIALKLL